MDRLLAAPGRFSFFQAVRLLQQMHSDRARLGHAGPPTDEPIRLKVNTSMAFPTTDIDTVERNTDGAGPPFQLVANFLGLHGSTSPLPAFYAEDVLHDTDEEGTLAAFLDIFHHRLLSLYYRAWERFRYHFLYAAGGKDNFSRAMFSLIGLGEASLVKETGFPAVRVLQSAGVITQKPHSAMSLRGMIDEYFGGVGVAVKQAMGRWLPIPRTQQVRLGNRGGKFGQTFLMGERVYDRLSKFRVSLGPLDIATYRKFLPGGEWYPELKKIIALFNTDMLNFDIELLLRAEDAPALSMQLTGEAQLGWTTGFFTKPPREDLAVVFA